MIQHRDPRSAAGSTLLADALPDEDRAGELMRWLAMPSLEEEATGTVVISLWRDFTTWQFSSDETGRSIGDAPDWEPFP